MATTKPRINVTLEQRSYDVIKSISETSGRPMSSFISELLEGAMPTLERMAVTFQKIKQAQDGDRARFLETIDEAQAEIEPVVMEAIGQFDLFMGKIDAAVEGKARGGAADTAVPATAAPIPRTNRGVTPIGPKPLQPSAPKALKAVQKKEVLKKVKGCTCHVTKWERQENKTCPVHSKGVKSHAI